MAGPLEVKTYDYGDEFWFGGNNGQTVHVGEDWMAGCRKTETWVWERLQREALIIASALAPADTVERQMALAVLAGDDAAALALADRLCEERASREGR